MCSFADPPPFRGAPLLRGALDVDGRGRGLPKLIGTGHSHTQEIFTLTETARATNRHVAGVQGLQRSCEARSGEGSYFSGTCLRPGVRAIQARAVKDPRDKLAVSKLEDESLKAHAAPSRS